MPRPRPEILHTPTAVHGGRAALSPVALSRTTSAVIDFSVCLNAFGPAASVSAAIAACAVDEYPDPTSRAARMTAAVHWQRPIDEIMLGAGSVELIQAACFAYIRPGDTVLVATPCFAEYARAASLCGATVRTSASTGELLRQIGPGVRMVFVASPSSPMGLQMSPAVLHELADACAAADALLILDQAYDGFTAYPLGIPALAGHTHVVHLRSMTKEHAIANVRVAFAIAPPDVVEAIERARVPWAASGAAQAAAIATLSPEARAHAHTTTTRLHNEAERIRHALSQQGFEVSPSDTHYLLVSCGDATRVRDWLLEHHGLLVRDCTSFGLASQVRIAARRPEENDTLIDAFAHLRSTLMPTEP